MMAVTSMTDDVNLEEKDNMDFIQNVDERNKCGVAHQILAEKFVLNYCGVILERGGEMRTRGVQTDKRDILKEKMKNIGCYK
jgi:hypothetical protein